MLSGPLLGAEKTLDLQRQRQRHKHPRSVDQRNTPLSSESCQTQGPLENHHEGEVPLYRANLSSASAGGGAEPSKSNAHQERYEQLILETPTATIVRVAEIFTRKFPELAFLHLPTFSGCWKADDGTKHWVHIASMLALCCSFLSSTSPGLLDAEDYAICARDGLSRIVMDFPNRTTVQALLTLAMYEWGCGNGYSAWMYSGNHTKAKFHFTQVLITCRHGDTYDAVSSSFYHRRCQG